jgi:hypothetical protein
LELLKRKTIIAVLWIIWAMSMTVFMFVFFLEPGVIKGIVSGGFDGMRISQGSLFFVATFWFVPWILAYLSLTLKSSTCRWLNFILGILFTIGLLIGLVRRAIDGQPVAMIADYFLAVVATALIAWHAWKLPEEEA